MTGRSIRNAALLLMGAAFLFACVDSTRIEGKVSLAAGFAAPDNLPHTLYVAAFSTTNGTVFLNTAANPVLVEFGSVSNADFSPTVFYELGGAGGEQAVNVFVWWKVNDEEQLDYEPPATGDLFGKASVNPVFPGDDGNQGGGDIKGIDVILDAVFLTSSAAF
jgi:hypothetical protein